MIVEGINCVCELIKAQYPVEKVIIEKDRKNEELMQFCINNKVKYEMVDRKGLEKISKSTHAQGVLCFVKEYEYCFLEDILENPKGEAPFLLILDGIEDPHNLGAIIRTAECMGVDGIVIGKNRACEVNETVFKTSTGAVAHMKIAKVVNLSQTIEKLKKLNIWCYALEAGEQTISKVDLKGGLALVVGSEGFGVSRLVKESCDATLSINMFGKINSLNASNACAIALYEATRQRNN